jgi:hypothetical protein
LFSLLWTAAVVVTADAHMRGGRTGLAPVYRRALSRYLAVLVASVLFGLVIVGLTLVASVLFVLTVFGVLGSLVALVGAIVWWLKPSARKPWLKWLIILTAPFGLPTYFGVRWAMYIAAIVLEGSGPVASLRRSGQLTDGHWFRVGAILAVASLVVGVLQSLPTYLVQIPLSISALARGQPGLSPTEEAISYAVSIAAQIVFASIGLVVYALLFVDLRNRREGTDIVERLSQLEASPVSTNG